MIPKDAIRFKPKRQGIILVISAVIIWIGSFLFLLWFFSIIPYTYGSEHDLFPFLVNFSALLATLICIQTWLIGFLDYIERFVTKRNLVRHLKKLERKRFGMKK
jgi:hypothetical protein